MAVDTLIYRRGMTPGQLHELKSLMKELSLSLGYQGGLNRDQDFLHDLAVKFLSSINTNHKNLVFRVDNGRIVDICLYACDPESLANYKHLYLFKLYNISMCEYYGVEPAPYLKDLVAKVEAIAYKGGEEPKDPIKIKTENGILEYARPGKWSPAPFGTTPVFRASKEDCKTPGDYYFDGRYSWMLDDKHQFINLNSKQDGKNQLQGEETPGCRSSEGCIIYGRRDKFEYSAGRHCNEASAKGQEGGVRRYQVILSSRSPEVHQYKR